MTEPTWYILQPPACTCIDDGHALAWALGPGGELWPLLRDLSVTEITHVPMGEQQAGRLAGHERVGPLPPPWQARVDWCTQPRCGRPRADGKPCRSPVARHGLSCHHHRNRGRLPSRGGS